MHVYICGGTSALVSEKTLAVVIYMWFLMFLERINIRELEHTIVPAYTAKEHYAPLSKEVKIYVSCMIGK